MAELEGDKKSTELLLGKVLGAMQHARQELQHRDIKLDEHAQKIVAIGKDVEHAQRTADVAVKKVIKLEDKFNDERVLIAGSQGEDKGRRQGVDWLTGTLLAVAGCLIGVIGLYVSMS